MYKVMKRDGTIAEFDIAKISKAITGMQIGYTTDPESANSTLPSSICWR